jgi:hypothetical protein
MSLMKPFLLFCALICTCINASSQTIMGRQIVDQFPVNNAGGLTYGLTWLPTTYANTTRSYPLIIFLHGAGETGTTVATLSKLTGMSTALPGRIANGWNAVAVNPKTGVQDSFIVVSPQAPSWSYNYAQLKYILPAILNNYRVDRSRIYLTGLSAGGGGTFTTMGSRDELFIKNFAAIVTASSAGADAANGYTAVQVEAGLRFASSWGVRAWTIAGEQDYLLDNNVRYHDSTNMLNPTPRNKLTVLQTVAHSAWVKAYDPAFRPVTNYYGNNGSCNNGCNNGGITVALNNNGSTMMGSGVTQDSLNMYEWLLLAQRPTTDYSPNIGDYRSASPVNGRWSVAANWKRYDGVNWVTATTAPSAASGTITILANDSIDVDVAVTVDQLIVANGAKLSVQNAGLTIGNGPGADLVVNGTMYLTNSQTISGAGTAEVNGLLNWYSGTVSVVTETKSSATVNLLSDGVKTLNANFTNLGTVNWLSGLTGGDLILNAATFTNHGLVNEEFQSNRGLSIGSGTTAFINYGTFKKKSANAFSNNSVPFTSTGILQGIGSYNFNTGTIVNNGIIKPGNSPGILTINGGALTGQNTVVRIEIFNGSGAGAGHNRLDLTGNITLTGNDLVVTELPGVPAQSYTILTTTGVFTGNFDAVTLPSGYTLAQTASSISVTKLTGTLPVVWGAFSAIHKSGDVVLNWNTLQEENTSHFAVEYSNNGIDFTVIANVQASGNSALGSAYRFTHQNPLAGKNFYRIKLYDADGKTSQSAVRVVKFENGTIVAVQALPNPMTSQLQLQVQEQVVVQLADAAGRLYLTQQLNTGVHYLQVEHLPAGMYQLTVLKGNQLIETKKIMKQ